VREVDAVQAYLARRPGAQSIIRSAVDVARRIMGDAVQLSLEIYRDPELGGEQLSLYIRSHNYTDDFFKRLQQVAKEVRPLRAGKDDCFLATSDFQPPR
jgi:hypothetical protein